MTYRSSATELCAQVHEHPDPMCLVDFMVGRPLGRGARAKLLAHCVVCERCADQLEALARLRCGLGLPVPLEYRVSTVAAVQ